MSSPEGGSGRKGGKGGESGVTSSTSGGGRPNCWKVLEGGKRMVREPLMEGERNGREEPKGFQKGKVVAWSEKRQWEGGGGNGEGRQETPHVTPSQKLSLGESSREKKRKNPRSEKTQREGTEKLLADIRPCRVKKTVKGPFKDKKVGKNKGGGGAISGKFNQVE